MISSDEFHDHTGSYNGHTSTNVGTTNELVDELVDSCNFTQTQHHRINYVEISGTVLFAGGSGGLGKGTGTERSPALSSLFVGCEVAIVLLGFCVHKPFSVANWTSRFDVEEAENSSIIGICRMFIFGVITSPIRSENISANLHWRTSTVAHQPGYLF